jgi:copper chaperone NosL
MKANKLNPLSKVLIGIATLLIAYSIFVPLWEIELDAPQYPEGLSLIIWPNAIAGDVEIINGLNHYIGMQTLHTKDFIEFQILPYILGTMAFLSAVTLLINRKRILQVYFILFVIFGITAMADFWRWEYNYGHNLNPNAAIVVPGMAYQPPLIGFKQLLNFGAYSIPSTGGWLILASGMLLLAAVVVESKILSKLKPMKSATYTLLLMIGFISVSCTTGGPQPIKINHDQCDFCRMTITENQFSCEIETNKNKIYKFDDLSCMRKFAKANGSIPVSHYWISNYSKPGTFIDATTAFFVKSEAFISPMSGNTAATDNEGAANELAHQHNCGVMHWNDVNH